MGNTAIQLLKCLGLLILYLYTYMVFGSILMKIFKRKFSWSVAIIIGYMVYFGLFQFVALPLIFTKQTVTMLATIWMPIMGVIVIGGTIWCAKMWVKDTKDSLKSDTRSHPVLIVVMLVMVAFQMYYMVRANYNAIDTQYYMGTVSQSVASDTMFIYNGATGYKESALNIRYAMAGYLMNAAMHCKVFGIHQLLEMKMITVAITCICNNLIIYNIARAILKKERKKFAPLAVCLSVLFNFYCFTIYTTSEFLLTRGYEGKSVVANIIMPILFLIFVWIWKDENIWFSWAALVFVSMACNAFALSSILIVPAMISGCAFAKFCVQRQLKTVVGYILCMLPCAFYIVAFYLSWKGILVIAV